MPKTPRLLLSLLGASLWCGCVGEISSEELPAESEAALALMPNLVVSEIISSPAEPKEGEKVVFSARITNAGSAATPAGVKHGVSFWIDGKQVTWSDDDTRSLAAGSSKVVTSNGGPAGAAVWTARSGTHSLMAWVDDVNRMGEANESDNKLTRSLSVTSVATPSCSDGVQNGVETGVDCGGSCGSCAWPFTAVSRATLRKSTRKVFAHWHYYPVALNNVDPRSDYYTAQWVSPYGEGGKHAAYGGFMRERPLPRLVRPEADWLLRDMEQDVRLAAGAGIDGFFMNIWTNSDVNNGGLWTRALTLAEAAARVGGFEIIPNFDMSILESKSDADALSLMLSMLKQLKAKASLSRLGDGRYMVGAFRAESRPPAFYTSLKQRASAELQMSLYLVPVFLGTGTGFFSSYAGVSDAFAGWGTAIPTNATNVANVTKLAGGHGRPWIHPIGSQDFRPYNFRYWEARNTQTLRTHWEAVIAQGAQMVQIVTWNDQHEHHAIRPSTGKQWSAYDLTAYYVQWFKTGVEPTLRRDALYYSHRVHAANAPYDKSKQTAPFTCAAGCPAVDEVELLAFLTAPGTLEISLAGKVVRQEAVAGRNVMRVPLAVGRPTFRLIRSGATVASVASEFPVASSTTFQDFLYRGGSSLRAALSSVKTCASSCETGDAARCELCPAEPMWLKR